MSCVKSRSSTENSCPSPLALDQCRILDLLVTRSLMVHLFWYMLRDVMGVIGFMDPVDRMMGAKVAAGGRL